MSKRALMLIALAIVVALTPFAFAGTSAGAAPGGAATVGLAVDGAAFDAKQSVLVHVTIANPTDRPVRVLRWFTPAGDVEESLFTVLRDGQAVDYTGPVYKRPAPTAEDFLVLNAGESLTVDVDLAAYYDLSVSGNYVIQYNVASRNLFTEKGTRIAQEMKSNAINLWIDGRPAAAPAPAFEGVTGSTTFNKCTTTQQSLLITARTEASTYSANAVQYLNGNLGARYTTWFGVYSASRFNTVSGHFDAIKGAMDTAPVKFDCGCKKKYYAYVYPDRPYVIYLCSIFWKAPMTGTDSKAGTLIHEMSHFNVVASTDDYVYGQAGAKSLAITNPDNAVNNADNHEYFAENTPYLP